MLMGRTVLQTVRRIENPSCGICQMTVDGALAHAELALDDRLQLVESRSVEAALVPPDDLIAFVHEHERRQAGDLELCLHRALGAAAQQQAVVDAQPLANAVDALHLLTVCRYVERNPLRANLVRQVETWRWSSLWHRMHDTGQEFLDDSWLPVERDEWLKQVDRLGSEAELAALRRSLLRGAPFGDATWRERTARQLGLESTLRARGRPRLGTAQLG